MANNNISATPTVNQPVIARSQGQVGCLAICSLTPGITGLIVSGLPFVGLVAIACAVLGAVLGVAALLIAITKRDNLGVAAAGLCASLLAIGIVASMFGVTTVTDDMRQAQEQAQLQQQAKDDAEMQRHMRRSVPPVTARVGKVQ